jgi:endonuclease I
MRNILLVVFALQTLAAFADVLDVLPNKQLAYYSAEFYSKKPTKEFLHKVLNEYHLTSPGKHDVITNNCAGNSCYRHSSVGYEGARKILFGEIYSLKDSDGKFIEDVYCGKKFYFKSVEDVNSMHTEVNIEHTWPQSRFNRNFDKNIQKSDMHHLFLTDSNANNRRANHEFGDVSGTVDELNVENCHISKLGHIGNGMRFTPPAPHRGNVARALFYFATNYNLFISPAEEMILRQWHKIDPVDQAEKIRHDIIAKHQKVRNPFVDYPDMVDQISDF